jgi:hypothetical protein
LTAPRPCVRRMSLMRRMMPPVKVANETKAELREKSHCLSIDSRTFADASSAGWSA